MLSTGQRMLVMVLALLLLSTIPALAGEFWQFGEFPNSSETYRYRITTEDFSAEYGEDMAWEDDEYETEGETGEGEEGEAEEENGEEGEKEKEGEKNTVSYYEVAISRENGMMTFEITNEWNVPEEEFYGQDEMERLVSFYYGRYFNLPMMSMAGILAGNSMMFLMNAQNLELEVGMMMSTWDGGMIKVTGMESLAGLEGYVCEFSKKAEDETGKMIRRKTAEYIICPTVSMPLSTRVFDENTGSLISSMELISYTAVE